MITTILVLIIIPCKSSGDIFRWIDDEGVIHFTDDMNKIPAEYRKKVERRAVPKERGNEKVSSPAVVPEPLEKKIEIKQPSTAMGEEDWRAAFQRLSHEIQARKEELDKKKAFIKEIERRRNMAFYIPNRIVSDEDAALYEKYIKEVSEDEKKIEELEKQLTDLKERAKKAGISERIFEVR